MQTLSLSENKYFLIFVDDFTRMTWVYFLKEKYDAFFFLRNSKCLLKIKVVNVLILRPDRGGEFTSKEFSMFCSDMGNRRELTTSYTPQQNRVAERKNRTIVKLARSMVKDKGLPKCYWAEAVATTMYLMNRFPTKEVRGKTPYEA